MRSDIVKTKTSNFTYWMGWDNRTGERNPFIGEHPPGFPVSIRLSMILTSEPVYDHPGANRCL